MKKIILYFLIIFLPPSNAGVVSGIVTQINVRADDNMHYFFLDTPISRRAPCAKNDYWVIKDEKSLVGQSQLSMLLTAYASGRTVKVKGFNSLPGGTEPYGTCSRDVSTNNQGEDVRVLILK